MRERERRRERAMCKSRIHLFQNQTLLFSVAEFSLTYLLWDAYSFTTAQTALEAQKYASYVHEDAGPIGYRPHI